MKSKTKTYVLLVAVIAIWGIIGFKIVSTINPEAPEVNRQNDMIAFTPKKEVLMDTFSIQLVERDPFLGTLLVDKQKNSKPKFSMPTDTLTWIPIIYHGTVSKRDSKERIFVISIDGQQQVMKVGQELKGVRLIRVTDKEVVVSYKGARKTIPKL